MNTEKQVAIDSTGSEPEAGMKQLERQVERGQLYAHSVLGESSQRLGEVQVFLHGLADTLIDKGIVTTEELSGAMMKVRRELSEREELNGPRTLVRIERSSDPKAPVKVDCEARLHVCHAVCCRLHFALSIPEIESGNVKWDLGRPYFIRHDSEGSCAHLNRQEGACGIYANRPGVCRSYSCAEDARIWKDFEKMELNNEWIEANLSATEPRVIRALMHEPKSPGDNPLAEADAGGS